MRKRGIATILLIVCSSTLFGWNIATSIAPWISWICIAILWEGLVITPSFVPGSTTVRVALTSTLWGFVTVFISHRWLLWLHPLNWLGIPPLLSFLIALLVLVFSAIAGGLLVGTWSILAIWLDPRRCFSAFILAGVWGLVEVFMAKGPFFWVGLGASILPNDRILANFATLGGVGTLAAIQLLIGWCFWKLVLRTPEYIKNVQSSVMLWLILITWLHMLACYQQYTIGENTVYDKQSLLRHEKVLVWQPSISTRKKFDLDEQIKLLARLKTIEIYSKALSIPLVLAPEGMLNINYFLDKNPAFELLTGGFHYSQDHTYSGVLGFIPKQDPTISWIDKRRLVPLGEWIPFRNIWQWNGLSAIGGIDQGESSRVFNREKETVGIAICYELSDGTALAAATYHGTSWLMILGNLDPYRGLLQKQFEALAQLRAIETGRWLINVSNTGPTSTINNQGVEVQTLPAFLPSLGIMELQKVISSTPYSIFGEWFLAIMTLGAGVMLVVSRSIKPPPKSTSPE